MESRKIIITIDDVMALFKDYCTEEDIPSDAMPLKLMIKPAERLFAIVADSEGWKHGLPPLQVKFDIKRIFGVS